MSPSVYLKKQLGQLISSDSLIAGSLLHVNALYYLLLPALTIAGYISSVPFSSQLP